MTLETRMTTTPSVTWPAWIAVMWFAGSAILIVRLTAAALLLRRSVSRCALIQISSGERQGVSPPSKFKLDKSISLQHQNEIRHPHPVSCRSQISNTRVAANLARRADAQPLTDEYGMKSVDTASFWTRQGTTRLTQGHFTIAVPEGLARASIRAAPVYMRTDDKREFVWQRPNDPTPKQIDHLKPGTVSEPLGLALTVKDAAQ